MVNIIENKRVDVGKIILAVLNKILCKNVDC